MWLMAGILRLLWHYDSTLPYAVNDFTVDGPFFHPDKTHLEPSPLMAACLPCHFNTSAAMLTMQNSDPKPGVPADKILKRCPCTPEDACELRREACTHKSTRRDSSKDLQTETSYVERCCAAPGFFGGQDTNSSTSRNELSPCGRTWFQGGAGIALSEGLVSLLSEDHEYEVIYVDA